jgi:hypothetical protein
VCICTERGKGGVGRPGAKRRLGEMRDGDVSWESVGLLIRVRGSRGEKICTGAIMRRRRVDCWYREKEMEKRPGWLGIFALQS